MAWDGAEDCFVIENTLGEVGYPGTLDFLLERAEYWAAHEPIHTAEVESRESTLAHLSEGYNIVLHVGHGSWDRWAVGDGRLETTDLPLLTNGTNDRFFIAYGVNCSSASIVLDGFGEQLVLLPDQGALAYIGSTYASSAGWAAELAQDFFYYLYIEEGGTLGDGFYGSAAANAAVGDMIIFGRALLGDPAMRVWRGTPGPPGDRHARHRRGGHRLAARHGARRRRRQRRGRGARLPAEVGGGLRGRADRVGRQRETAVPAVEHGRSSR